VALKGPYSRGHNFCRENLTRFIPQSILRHVRILFQNQFFTQRDLVLPLSVSNILLFLYGRPVAASVFFHFVPSFLHSVFPKITVFRRQFLRQMWSIQLTFHLFIVCRVSLFLEYAALHFSQERPNRSFSFSSTTVQKFPGISYAFPEVPMPYSAVLHMQQFISLFLQFNPVFWCKEPSSC
jgi:hypothetical protein